MQEVNIESLSPTSITTEEETQDTLQVGSGGTLEEQAAAEDLQMQELQDPQPVSELEKQQIRTEEAYPAAKEEARRAEELTSPEIPQERLYPETSWNSQYRKRKDELAEKGGRMTNEEKTELFNKVGGFYRDNVLSMNMGEGKTIEGRLDAINKATKFRVAKLNEKGEILIDKDGKPMYQDVPFAGTHTERRLVQLFEGGDQHIYDSGIYKLFNKDQELGHIDIGLQAMRQKRQNPVAAWFSRTETEEGGLSKFIDVMKKANPKINPARLTYMAKKQAEAGPFSGIEGERTWGSIRNGLGFLVNMGVGAVEWVGGEAKGLGKAYDYITGTPSSDVTNASANTVAATVLENVAPENRDDDSIEAAYRRVLNGDLTPLEILNAVDVFKEAYPGANDAEVAAFFGYSPDAFTQTKRIFAESAITTAGFVGITARMAATERKAFMDFVRDKTGDTTFTDAAGALKAAQNSDLTPTQLMHMFREHRGSRKMFSDFRARALDFELNKASPYRNDIIQPEIDLKRKKLEEVRTKIDALKGPNDRPKMMQSLQAQRKMLEDDLLALSKKRRIPPHLRDYFVDDTIANTTAGLAYQAIYDASGGNEGASSIASFVAAIGVSLPSVRRSFGETKEDFKAIFKHGVYGEGPKNARAGRRMLSILRDSPPQLREETLMFMERKAQAIEEFAVGRYPDNYPDPNKAGKPIISEEALSEGYWRMSGLLSLRAVNQEIRKSSIDIQKDVGQLNEKLWNLEETYRQERELMTGMAQTIDAMKYYRMSDNYDPNTESGLMVDTLINFYDDNLKRLDFMEVEFKDLEAKNMNDIASFFDGSIRGDMGEKLAKGDVQLSQLLNVGWERHRDYNLPKDATLEQELDLLQSYYNDVANKVNHAFEQNRRVTFDEKDVETTNNLFREFLITQRAKAYAEGNAAFNALRSNPLYQDARMDLTDIAETLIRTNNEGTYFDEKALAEFLPTYRKSVDGGPVESLAALKFAGQTLPTTNSEIIRRLFNEGAGSYLNDLVEKGFGPKLQEIFDDADLDEAASSIERFFVYKNWYDVHGKAEMPAELYDDLAPRLGVDATTFTHLAQGLGSSKNRLAWQLRDKLLDDAKTNFFDNFYAPKSDRVPLEGFAEDYEKARNIWEKRVKEPFEEMNSSIRTLSKDGDLARLSPTAFESFMKQTVAGKEGVFNYELRAPGGFLYEIEKIMGKPLDVTTPEGKQVKDLLNAYVTSEIARTPGGMALRRYLSTTPEGELFAQGVTPASVGKIVRGIADSPTPLLDNLTRRDPTDPTKALFVDVNGVPLIDTNTTRVLGIDSLMSFGVTEAANAVKRVDMDIQAISDQRLRELKDANSPIRKQLEERQAIVKIFRNTEGGLGKAIISKAQTEGGMDDIAAMRADYIKAKVSAGVPEEKAAAYWDDTVREATIEHIMNRTMSAGEEVPSHHTLPDGGTQIKTEEVASINPESLGEILGIRGGGMTSKNEAVMRGLLGDETYDHMRKIYGALYDPTIRTGNLAVTGTSMPMSAESLLSRGTSFFRGVISLRWLISEAAIRKSRQNNYELTKMMLSNPKVGEQILNMVMDNKFNLDRRTPEFFDMLISQIARNDAIQRYAAEQGGEEYVPTGMETMLREEQQQKQEEEQRLEEMQQGMTTAA